MGIIEIGLIALGLAMDAFAVSVCKGLAIVKITTPIVLKIGLWFGGFQAIMPILGYFLGNLLEEVMTQISHLIAFILLTFIGGNMIKEAKNKDFESFNDTVNFKVMLGLAVATSIDALTVGVTFSFLQVNILLAASIIGSITFFMTMIGTKIGNQFGNRYEKKAQIVGGLILVILGIKNLFEHFKIG